MSGDVADARRRVLALLPSGRAGAREEAILLAEALVAAHAQHPLAHITLGTALSGPSGQSVPRLERAWAAFREALALGADEGQRALCVGLTLALEQRIADATAAGDTDADAAIAALARMRAAESLEPLVAAQLTPAADGNALLATALPAEPMRVTLLSGFLGAGKTTMLRRILTGSHGRRVAVVVNDMAKLNVDARLVRADAAASAAASGATDGAPLVELTNGCICCTLRSDLVEQLAALGRSGRYELCIVESTGVSEPLAVAQAFAQADAEGVSLALLARLDTMVTLLDAAAFLADLTAGDSLQERRMAVAPTDSRDLATLMVEQLEVADVVVINKADLVPEGRLRQLEAFVRATNRTARVLRAVRAEVPLDEVLATGRFDLAAAASSAGWVRELMGEHAPETEAYGIISHVYTRAAPFDACRLWEVVAGDPPGLRGVLRSKGYAWVAQQPALVLEWQAAGNDTDCRVAGTWAAPVAGAPPAASGEYSDRRTELVFIGIRLERAEIDALLDGALASAEELAVLEVARGADGVLRLPQVGGALARVPDGMAGMFANALAAFAPEGGSEEGAAGAEHAHSHSHAHLHAHC